MEVGAISVSKDCKWIVCGTTEGASVWNEKIQEMAIDVEGEKDVSAVDVSPDSSRFATVTDEVASIWNIVTGERLVGPLKHDSYIMGVKFSPNDERVATAREDSIRLFDSHNGDQLITLKAILRLTWAAITPIAWSNDGQQIFAASGHNKISAFNSFTGSQLAESESQVHNGNDDESKVVSIALAANGKFLSTFVADSVSFWDTSTLVRISSPIKDSGRIQSIALSTDCSYVAIGTSGGKITIRNLSDILPDSYGPFHVLTQEEPMETPRDVPKDKQSSTSRARDNKAADSTVEQPTTSSVPESENQGEVGGDLLEAEVPTSAPAPLFDYDEEPSLVSSTHLPEGEVALPGSSQALPQLPDAPVPMTNPPEAPRAEEHHDTAELSGSITVVKRWLQTIIRRGEKNQGSHRSDRLSREPGQPANSQSRSNSLTRGNTASEGPSRMAAAHPRALIAGVGSIQGPTKPKSVKQSKTKKKTTEGSNSNKVASTSGQGDVDPKTVGPGQQANDASEPSVVPTGLRVVQEAGDATVWVGFKFSVPVWMLCRSRVNEDGTH